MTTVSPNAPTSTFAGLRSRWMTRRSCANASASTTAITLGSSASRSPTGVLPAIVRSSDSPSTSFIT